MMERRRCEKRRAGTLARGWRTDADTLPFLKDRVRYDDHWYVRRVAVQGARRGWRTDADTLPILKDRARYDQNEFVRQAAVAAARGWRTDADTLPILKDRARYDQNEFVRQAASGGWRGWANRPRHRPHPQGPAPATTRMGTFARRR